MRRVVVSGVAACLVTLGLLSGRSAAVPSPQAPAGGAPRLRVALVPADDRPVNLQDVAIAARQADIEVVTPPRSRLGGRSVEGDADGIVEWLDELDVGALDAVVVSTDMLVYGGRPASRQPKPDQATALSRLDVLTRLAARRSDLPVFAFGTLLPLAPVGDPRRAAVLAKLGQWAALAGKSEPEAVAERARLGEELPSLLMTPYLATRARNQAVTLALVKLATTGALGYLVLETDEPAARGLSAIEREKVTAALAAPALAGRTALVPSADGIAALLVARAAATRLDHHPGVQVEGEAAEDGAARTGVLATEVRALIGIAGARPVPRAGPRDFVLDLVVARDAATGGAAADLISGLIRAGRRVALADLALQGTNAGASVPLVEALRTRHLFPRLLAYAAQGEPRTTIAAALSQGVIVGAGLGQATPGGDSAATRRVAEARAFATLHRLVVDFAYGAVVRPEAVENYATPHHMNVDELDPDQTLRMQEYLTGEVKPLAESLVSDFGGPLARAARSGEVATVRDIDQFHLTLPWRRLADVEIHFDIVTR
jgi:Protein of unknown function (DUF4127)